MSVEALLALLSISGVVIIGLIGALWKVMLIYSKRMEDVGANVAKRMDDIGTDVAKILLVNGINNERLKTHEEQISFLKTTHVN